MRLLLAKDRLSTLDHQGSDQSAVRPKMVHRKSNQPKTKRNGAQRLPCGHPAQQASVTSFDAMQPSGCRGVQAGRQAEAGCSCALRWHLRPPGFARSHGGAARHLKQSVCCGVDGVAKIKVCRPNGPA
eukprot:scaffold13708_cov116-Isochrysis_galbana.AAC.2